MISEIGPITGTSVAAELQADKNTNEATKMVNNLRRKIKQENIKNIEIEKRDFVLEGSGFGNNSIDYVMLFNILHNEHPDNLLKEAFRILKSQGKLGIIHWNHDPTTPRGPPIAIRPKPERLISLAIEIGFFNPILFDIKPYHFGILMTR